MVRRWPLPNEVDDIVTTTTDAIDHLEAIFARMGADQLAHLAGNLYARATERRRCITVEEARRAVASAPLTPTWELSILAPVGRVRTATRLFVEQGFHPEQVVDAMAQVASEVIAHPAIEREAVACGLADGMATRERGDRDG